VTHALRVLPGIRDAAVLARTDTNAGDVQLTAYVVSDEATTPEDWRKAAEATLPAYMLPAHWVRLERLPLLPNGKLDRAALPDPRVAAAPLGEPRPLTPTEEVVAAVWMAVLSVPAVGPSDDFFALGGDSILSLRALSLLQGRGLDISLQLLTESSVLSELARAIDDRDAVARPSAATDTPEFDEDRYPLTQLQLGMLYHVDLTPAARVYQDISSIHVRLPLQLPLLQASLDLLAERHAVLRTSFDLTDADGPSQRVHPHVAMSLEVADWRGVPADEQERLLDAWMERERVTPFDVSRAPLIRFAVQQRSDDSFQLGSACHHAILDGWSSTVMRAELIQDYGRRVGLPLPPLPEAPANLLREYVRLERSTWDAPSSRTFWRDLLQDVEPFRLPRPVLAERVRGYTHVNVPIAADVWRAVNEHARGAALPPRTLCLAAHLRVCALLAGRTDVITGFVSNGRPELAGSDRSLGLFLNTLPLRLDVAWDDTWRHTCEAALARERAILPHRRFPLAGIQQDAGRGALFEVNFNFVNFHEYGPLLRVAGDRFLGSRSFSVTHFALVANFAVDPVSRLPGLELQFRDERFSEEQIAQITAAYRRAMESLALHGLDGRCSHRWLSQEMRLSALDGRRAAGVRHPLSWLDVHAAQRRDNPAVVSGPDVITYARLGERARRLAGALRGRGVSRGDLVGVCLERGADLVCAMVATLGMGAVYVPIDPSLPDSRMQTLLTHAGCRIVITIDQTAKRLAVPAEQMLLADRLDAHAAAGPPEWRQEADPEDLAYVIYTSGSTGQPKGVAMTCRAVMNLVEWQLAEWRTQPPRRTLLIASPGFDVSVQETLCTLASGGTLDVVTDDVKRDPDALWRHICAAGVERSFAPPVIVQGLADAAARSPRETRLHEIIAAGEALKITPTVRELVARHDISLVNQYGPTETHVVSSAAVQGARHQWPLLPPIGSPIAATNLAVLDAQWQPVPQGVAGELWIGGDCLAQGYLRDPVLTAERFVPDPLSRTPGGRVYRSGDRVICRDDLQLDYLGRLDGQLKIRGYRVEVGEIEVALAGCTGVKDAAVVSRPTHTGDPELWAFVVAADPSRVLDGSFLLNELRHRLPAYMVPARVAVIDRVPVLTNGKVDRQQLSSGPAPEAPAPITRPPVSAAEQVIAETIAAVLGLSAGQVGLDDDFFEIGGNSLTAVQVAVRLGDLVDRTVSVGVVVVNRTVAEIHAALTTEIGADRLEQIAETVKAVGALAMEDVEGMLNAGSPS
jgi:amino acid adenylation domain-containing protein